MSHLFCVGTELELQAEIRSVGEGHTTLFVCFFFFLTTIHFASVWILYAADAETLPSLSVAAFAVISYLSTISEGIFWMDICFCWINSSISHVLPCSPFVLRQGEASKQKPLKISILHAWFALGSEKKYKVMFSGCEPAGGCWAHSCSPVSLRLAVSGHASQVLSFSIPAWRDQTGMKPSLLFSH